MYHPTTRVLTVLELLQTYRQLSAAELAARLDVTPRSVRRYVVMLQDLGIPVESERGRYGGYRLRPGYKLPPLMLTNAEALAVTLGLLAVDRLGLSSREPAVEGAMSKIERVLPESVREQVAAVHAALVVDEPPPSETADSELVVRIGQAVRQTHPVWLRYRGRGSETERIIEPYGLVYRESRWYAVGWCRLRSDVRIFRLDRIAELRVLDEHFTPPKGFDARSFVIDTLDEQFAGEPLIVLLDTTLAEARRRIPRVMAALDETDDGVMMTCNTGSLQWMAAFLATLPWAVDIVHPPELIDAVERLATRAHEMYRRATRAGNDVAS